jgi:RNA polymerase sigma factor (sigma-70 family)
MEKKTNVSTTSVELTTEQVREMIANNQASLKESIRQHNYKLGLQLNRKDQDEILAVVNYKALLAADTYNPKAAKVKTWLSRIAYNEIVNHLKRRTASSVVSVKYIDECDDDGRFDDRIRQMHYRLDEVESQKAGFLGAERDRESLLKVERLNDAILSLKDRDQQVVCYLMQGICGREMAERLGISEVAQRKLVSDVRGRLKKRMQVMHYADIAERTDRYRDREVRVEEATEEMFGFMYASRSEMNG